jgi:hypothetical protein
MKIYNSSMKFYKKKRQVCYINKNIFTLITFRSKVGWPEEKVENTGVRGLKIVCPEQGDGRCFWERSLVYSP